eukprot:Sspe_Gene.81594::Locus_52478_Transcript_1_1_Confidence_1.000_Length_1706::g.81594::m.81594
MQEHRGWGWQDAFCCPDPRSPLAFWHPPYTITITLTPSFGGHQPPTALTPPTDTRTPPAPAPPAPPTYTPNPPFPPTQHNFSPVAREVQSRIDLPRLPPWSNNPPPTAMQYGPQRQWGVSRPPLSPPPTPPPMSPPELPSNPSFGNPWNQNEGQLPELYLDRGDRETQQDLPEHPSSNPETFRRGLHPCKPSNPWLLPQKGGKAARLPPSQALGAPSFYAPLSREYQGTRKRNPRVHYPNGRPPPRPTLRPKASSAVNEVDRVRPEIRANPHLACHARRKQPTPHSKEEWSSIRLSFASRAEEWREEHKELLLRIGGEQFLSWGLEMPLTLPPIEAEGVNYALWKEERSSMWVGHCVHRSQGAVNISGQDG